MKKPYFIIINCLLIIMGAYWGVDAIYQGATAGLQDAPAPTASTNPEAMQVDGVLHPLAHYNEIAGRNLFNVVGDQPKIEEPLNLEALEQTDLKLKLWGTVTGDEDGAYAVIEDTQARAQNLYRTEDTVQGAIVKMILREKVVLRVGVKDQVLEMEKGQFGTMASAGPLPQSHLAPMAEDPPGQTRSLLRSQIDDALGNVNDLMQQVKIMPHFTDGQPDGFSLTGIRPNSIFRKMGLRNGDIITGVNGDAIQTMEDALGFYKQLSDSDSVSVQIKRRGRENTFNYQIK